MAERRYSVPSASAELPAPTPSESENTKTAVGKGSEGVETLLDRYAAAHPPGRPFFGLPSRAGSTVFLIDISGSMLQRQGPATRLDLAYDELKQTLATLPEQSLFNVLLFAERVDQLFPQPQPASRANLIRAFRYLDEDINCGGSTDLQQGLRRAMAMKPELLLVLSDGIPTSSSPRSLLSEARYLREKNRPSLRLHTIGFFLAEHSEEERFLQKLAQDNNGIYAAWRR
ncbi:MAG: VWA domain-containing protein [Blastochloris sp.]|nr:VWA domain-containing protein [Blastochloris sp.]